MLIVSVDLKIMTLKLISDNFLVKLLWHKLLMFYLQWLVFHSRGSSRFKYMSRLKYTSKIYARLAQSQNSSVSYLNVAN